MNSNEFTQELGKVSLAAGRLEAELIQLYHRIGIKDNINKWTLGKLILYGKENNLVENNLFYALEVACKQRNYIAHNIYALFIDSIDETLLPKNDLLDTDVLTYTEKVSQTKINLIALADIISKK